MSDVAVIGLGRIGRGAARSLVRAGHSVGGYDVAEEATAALKSIVRIACSPREAAAEAEVVLIAAFDEAQVRDVLTGDAGVLTADPPPRAAVILSTVPLATIEWAAGEAAAADVGLVDCGVTGGGEAIERGSIVALVGGDADTVELARPVLEAFSSPMLHMGPLGSGMKAKLARNAIVFGCWYIVSEAARLAAAAGLDLDKLIEASDAADKWSGGPMALLARHRIRPADGDYADEASVGLRQAFAAYAHKDVRAALELGDQLGLELPGTALVERRFNDAVGLPIAAT